MLLVGELRDKRQCRMVLFISANTSGAASTTTKALKLRGTLQEKRGSGDNRFGVGNAKTRPDISEYGFRKKYICMC